MKTSRLPQRLNKSYILAHPSQVKICNLLDTRKISTNSGTSSTHLIFHNNHDSIPLKCYISGLR